VLFEFQLFCLTEKITSDSLNETLLFRCARRKWLKGGVLIVRRSDELLAESVLPVFVLKQCLQQRVHYFGWFSIRNRQGIDSSACGSAAVMAHSILAVTSVSTTLPAARITNRSPSLGHKQVREAHASRRCIPKRRRTDVVLFPAIFARRVYRVDGVIFCQRTQCCVLSGSSMSHLHWPRLECPDCWALLIKLQICRSTKRIRPRCSVWG